MQETKWKESKAKTLGGDCKLFYYGVNGKRNGVGIVVRGEYIENVMEELRVSDRMMRMTFDVGDVWVNIVCPYAPKASCEKKKNFGTSWTI